MLQHCSCSQVTMQEVFEVSVCVPAANGAEVERQSTNTLPGGPEGETVTASQPH